MILYEGPGDIFQSGLQTLVCPVNCRGAMGAGLALAFKQRSRGLHENYRRVCDEGRLQMGDLYLYPSQANGQPQILCLPTKDHWRDPSQLDYVERSLKAFVEQYKQLRVESCAFPALGCGLGGLDYMSQVRDVMYKYLGNSLPIDVEILVS